jgi:phosphoribosylformylglycinamidine cyclo-ligase
VRSLLPLVRARRINGLAHITGGGLLENIPRVLPPDCHAIIDADAWAQPRLMAFLQAQGAIEPEEMARTFNCGIGMVAIVAPDEAAAVTMELEEVGEAVSAIGRVDGGKRGCTVHGSADTWSARADWSARHDA